MLSRWQQRLALPLVTLTGEAFPHRHIILFLTFCVIFVTLVVQGLTLPWIARKLKVEEASGISRAKARHVFPCFRSSSKKSIA